MLHDWFKIGFAKDRRTFFIFSSPILVSGHDEISLAQTSFYPLVDEVRTVEAEAWLNRPSFAFL